MAVQKSGFQPSLKKGEEINTTSIGNRNWLCVENFEKWTLQKIIYQLSSKSSMTIGQSEDDMRSVDYFLWGLFLEILRAQSVSISNSF